MKINNNIDSKVNSLNNEEIKSKEDLTPHVFDTLGIVTGNKLHINNNLDKILQSKESNKNKHATILENEKNETLNNLNIISNSASLNINNTYNSQLINNPNNLINTNFNKQSYLHDTENRKKNIEATKKEFNDLAGFLNIKSSDDKYSSGISPQYFKIDLFSNNNKNSNVNKPGKNDDYDIIDIERDNNANIDKVKNMFDDFELDNNQEDDDLLDLMDLACKK